MATTQARSESKKLRGLIFKQWVVILFLAALALIGTSYYFEKPLKDKGASWVANLARYVGSLALGAALVDFAVGLPQVMDYATDRLDDALQGRSDEFRRLFEELLERNVDRIEFLSTLPSEKLEHAHANIIRILGKMEFRPTGRFYRTLRQDIEPLLGGLHYETQTCTFTNAFYQTDSLFYLDSVRWSRTEFHTWTGARIDVGFERHLQPLGDMPPEWLYELECYKVDDVEEPLPQMASSRAPSGAHIVVLHDERDITPGQVVVVERRERVRIPATDIIQWHVRPGRSLRHLNVVCTFTNASVFPKLHVKGFAEDNRQPSQGPSDCNVVWDGWMLPHHGFTISWNDPRPEDFAPASLTPADRPAIRPAAPTHHPHPDSQTANSSPSTPAVSPTAPTHT